MAYRFGPTVPTMNGGGEAPVHQKDHDWMAAILILLVFAALLAGIFAIATGRQVPFISRF
jgi:hypothetical protein